MGFLYIILALIAVSVFTYFFMQKIGNFDSSQAQRAKIETFRVKGTARGANGRVETSAMLEGRRKKVNSARSKI